jgi:Dockerin type I domain
LTGDKYLMSIPSAAVTSMASGQALDGEFVNGSGNLLPSGNATTGGDFNFQFNILPGDVDQNGAVNALDGAAVRQHFLLYANMAGYNPLFDTYGKGAITGIDFTTVQTALFSALPATDPTPPGHAGGGAAATTAPAATAAPSDASSTPPVGLGSSTGLAGGAMGSTATPTSAVGSGDSAFGSAALNSATGPTAPVVAGGAGDVTAASDGASASGPITAAALSPDSSPSSIMTIGGSTNGGDASTSTADVKASPEQAAARSTWNSAVSTITAEFHAGSLTVRDAVFAELDADGPLANRWRRFGPRNHAR